MAPVNLLCKGFLRALATTDADLPMDRTTSRTPFKSLYANDDDDIQILIDPAEDDDPATTAKLDARKHRMELAEHLHKSKPTPATVSEEFAIDAQLKSVMKRTISLRL